MNLTKLLYTAAKIKWFITRPISVGVRILLIQDDQVLLVKHTYQNSWYLPGGGVKKNETLEQAIHREVGEEVGGQIHELELFGAYTNFYDYKNDHIVIFLSKSFSLAGNNDTEIESVRHFPFDHLPHNISPGSKKRIEEYINNKFPVTSTW